jgi:hypothetical protein
MSVLPTFSPKATAAEARAQLDAAGWSEIARGDWSWVHASPDGETAVRVTPWDAAYRLHVEHCLRYAGHPHLPLVHAVAPLTHDGYAVFMQRLHPCPTPRAAAFCAALGFPRDTGIEDGEEPPDANTVTTFAVSAGLRVVLEDLFARASALPFFGGADIRPGNLMQDAAGVIKVIDPIYVAGRRIHAAIEAGDRPALEPVGKANLEAFLSIPVFTPGAETDALRAQLAVLFPDDAERQ